MPEAPQGEGAGHEFQPSREPEFLDPKGCWGAAPSVQGSQAPHQHPAPLLSAEESEAQETPSYPTARQGH